MEANVFNIQRMSTEDGPGIRTTVFMKGCPLRCAWCHNPEGLSPEPITLRNSQKCIGCGTCSSYSGAAAVKYCPTGAMSIVGRHYQVDELLQILLADREFYRDSSGGVTFSGGECLSQPRFLAAIIPELQAEKIHVAVDTSGFSAHDVFARIASLADLVLFDLKLFSADEHRRYTGQSNALILENARILGKMPIPVWIRIPIIPGITDSTANIDAISSFVKEYMPNVVRVDLLGYNDLCQADYERLGMAYSLKALSRVSKSTMENLRLIVCEKGINEVYMSNYDRGEEM